MSDAPSPPRWRRRSEARPQEILAAALAVFVEKGYSAARMEEVARRAGISKGALYLYYANKEALFHAVVEEGILPTLVEMEAEIDRHEGSAAGLLRQFARRWWQGIGNTPLFGLPKLVFCEARNFPELADYYFERVIRRGHALLTRIVEGGIAGGEFRTVDVQQTVFLAIAPLLMQAFWRSALPREGTDLIDPEALLETHIDTFLRGLRKEP